jgi:hypothetical protein
VSSIRPCHGVQVFQIAIAVERQDGHAILALHAQRQQAAGEP